MSYFRVLHLSDIHIGKMYDSSIEIADKIVGDIGDNGKFGIRCIVVTGDIFDASVGRTKEATEELIKEASSFFERILKNINKRSENEMKLSKNDIIFIPGNHDIIRDKEHERKFSKYKEFLKLFYEEKIPKFYNTELYASVKIYDESKTVFIGFNSCGLEEVEVFKSKTLEKIKKIDDVIFKEHKTKKENLIALFSDNKIKEYRDFGEISREQIEYVKREIEPLSNYNIIVLLHHHFYLFPEIVREHGDSSLVRKHTELTQQLQMMGVKAILHGHKHLDLESPLITDKYYETSEVMHVFAGGSVGYKGIDKHTFNIFDFFDKKDEFDIKQTKFTYEGERIRLKEKSIPPKKTTNKMTKLIYLLENNGYDLYEKYKEQVVKLNIIYNTCEEIIEWMDELMTGFEDVNKLLEEDPKNIFFLLFSIYNRTLSYKKNISKEDNLTSYFKILEDLFDSCNLEEVKKYYEREFHNVTDRKILNYTSFTMIGIFFTDLYLTLTEYADNFYSETIKFKVNIKLDENEFHHDVPAPYIKIESDVDRRSVYVSLKCKKATAHKMAVLFVKEFELLINKFEDYFKTAGLKLYYILPNINKEGFENNLDNYNFEAYIPTLIPLLTGENIYSSKEVFSREVIQNSIDAIAVRELKDNSEFDKNIKIEFGIDDKKRRFFQIKDNGTGMDRYKIERYLTSIGRSFYSGEEYQDLGISYKPISNFGIGFLSSFMVCKEIDVTTRSYIHDSENLKLSIPNYDGCFFVEKTQDLEVGTTIKLYLNNGVKDGDIINYIKKVMKDVKYNIEIKTNSRTEIIQAHKIRKNCGKDNVIFFIPINEKGDILDFNWESFLTSNSDINNFNYGIIIDFTIENDVTILNSGILVSEVNTKSLKKLFPKYFKEMEVSIFISQRNVKRYRNNGYKIVFNFPSNLIQMDVSREKALEVIMKLDFREEIFAQKLLSQLDQCLYHSKDKKMGISTLNFKRLNKYCCNVLSTSTKEKYNFFINYNSDEIIFMVTELEEYTNFVKFDNIDYEKLKKYIREKFEANKFSIRSSSRRIRDLFSFLKPDIKNSKIDMENNFIRTSYFNENKGSIVEELIIYAICESILDIEDFEVAIKNAFYYIKLEILNNKTLNEYLNNKAIVAIRIDEIRKYRTKARL